MKAVSTDIDESKDKKKSWRAGGTYPSGLRVEKRIDKNTGDIT